MATFKFGDKVVMFCDAHSFSKVLARLGDDFTRFLQDYYRGIGEIVVAAGGRIVKYMGDGMLFVFEAGAEEQAVNCARKLRTAYSGIVQRLGLPGVRSELEVGIGAGRVCHGMFGHPSLRLSDVFGEAVSETAVLMHYRGIAVTKAVHDALGREIKLRALPDRKVKWRKEPLKAWRVLET